MTRFVVIHGLCGASIAAPTQFWQSSITRSPANRGDRAIAEDIPMHRTATTTHASSPSRASLIHPEQFDAASPPVSPDPDAQPCHESPSAGAALVALGWEIDANQYRAVHLAARYDEELEWHHLGLKSAASWISKTLQVHSSTAREWIRVGYALRDLPLIDAAFAAHAISYAKVRVLTRWAEPDNEAELLAIAHERSADRLTTALARALADGDETDEERDARLHDCRSVTSWTDGDGMTIIRIALAPSAGKTILAAVDEVVRRIAEIPIDGSDRPSVTAIDTEGGRDAPADAPDRHSMAAVGTERDSSVRTLPEALAEVRRRWQPTDADAWTFPTRAQQRADALAALFLGLATNVSPEVIIHVRGDGITFDDGTPTTASAVVRQLDGAFIRLLLHDAERRPVNASSRRRCPTPAQRRVAMEAHHHECVDCQSTDLLELDHNPPFHQTRRTVTHELEPRCAPCHRARHRHDPRRAMT